MNKPEIIKCLMEEVWEYKNSAWYKERGCDRICAQQFETVERIDVQNTQGHAAWDGGKAIHIFIRGSDEPRDWWGKTGNFNFIAMPLFTISETFNDLKNLKTRTVPITKNIDTDIRVEAGFLSGWKQVKPEIIKLIDKVGPDEVIIVGHSRGAAIAALGAENIGYLYPDLMVKGIYFSSPRPGNKEFSEAHSKIVDDYAHYYILGDPVVATPLLMMGYRPVENTDGFFGGFTWPPFVSAHYPDNLLNVLIKKLK